MTRYKTRKINITCGLSKRRQRRETDSWWHGFITRSVKKLLPHTTGTSRLKQFDGKKLRGRPRRTCTDDVIQ